MEHIHEVVAIMAAIILAPQVPALESTGNEREIDNRIRAAVVIAAKINNTVADLRAVAPEPKGE